MAKLVTLNQAKNHLKIDHNALDDEIDMMIEATTQTIFDYLKRNPLAYQDTSGSWIGVKQNWIYACLVWITILFEDQDDTQTELGQIPRKVSRLLYIDRNLSIS